ncbi:MAG: insulinase family protein [Myxococcales bacterium]|nr:insulinase family protein [Myxococcales bacterium]
MRAALLLLLLGLAPACALFQGDRRTDVAEQPAAAEPPAAAAPPPVRWTRTQPPEPLPAAPRSEPRSTRAVLPNGLEVVVVEHHARALVSLRLFFPDGAAADPPERAGVTWFTLAGLLATHDEKDVLGDRVDPSEKSMRRLVLEQGGALRFDVGEDRAWLGIDGFSRDATRYVDWLNRALREARHGEDSFEAAATSVADSLEELELTDGAALEQFLGRLSFGAGHPYARPVYGSPDSVAQLGLEDLLERQSTLLRPRGSTLLIAGDVDPQEMIEAVRRHLGAWRPGKGRPALKLAAPRVQARRTVTYVPRRPAKTTLVCAARSLSDVKGPAPVLSVLAAVLTERLEQSLRERGGFAYSVAGSLLRLKQARALLLCTRLDATRTQEGLDAFVTALASVSTSPLVEAEVARARACLAAGVDASVDDLAGVVALYGQAVVLGETASVAERAAALRAVSLVEVEPLAKKVANSAQFQLVMSGERALVAPAVKALQLGTLVTPHLSRAPAD